MTFKKNNTDNKKNDHNATVFTQSVNFCSALPKHIEVAVCSAKQIIGIAFIFLSLLLGLYGYQLWGKTQLQKEVVYLQNQEQTLTAKIAPILKKYGLKSGREEFLKKLSSIEKEIKIKRQLVAILGGESAQTFKGFSVYLKAFAKLLPQDAWLNSISIDRYRGMMEVNGYTFSHTAILKFVSKLNKTPQFQGYHFRLQKLGQREAAQHNAMSFKILARGGGK